MALNRGTQKQIAQRFKGNLDYFRKPHYWRTVRLWTILAIVIRRFGEAGKLRGRLPWVNV